MFKHLLMCVLVVFCTFIMLDPVVAQSCPGSSTSELKPRFTSSSQTFTTSINLAPCQTLSVVANWNYSLVRDKGTNFMFKYLNSSGDTIFSQEVSAFNKGTFKFPNYQTQPFPWRGTVGPQGLPVTLKILSGSLVGYPPLDLTVSIEKTSRANYNLGGSSFGNALQISSIPSTYYGSLRPEDSGQFFKVTLAGNQSIFLSGYAEGKTNVGGGFTIDIYDSTFQDLTPTSAFLTVTDYGVTPYSSTVFTNPNSTTADFYIKLWTWPWSVLNFTMTVNHSNCTDCKCPPVVKSSNQ
jgi:hypothetical protein